jgi:hypothetical protein
LKREKGENMKMKICKEEKKTVSMRRKVEKIED